jgi:hypothetical protein
MKLDPSAHGADTGRRLRAGAAPNLTDPVQPACRPPNGP